MQGKSKECGAIEKRTQWRSVWAVNQREVISFALQITEEKDLLAIRRNIPSFLRVGVLCKTEGKIGWEIC